MNWVFKKEGCLARMFGRWYSGFDDRGIKTIVGSMIVI
jgi:hypothetical protein